MVSTFRLNVMAHIKTYIVKWDLHMKMKQVVQNIKPGILLERNIGKFINVTASAGHEAGHHSRSSSSGQKKKGQSIVHFKKMNYLKRHLNL